MPDLTPAEQRTAAKIDEATCTCGHGVYLHHPTGSCGGQNYGPPEEGFPRLPACECARSLGWALMESRALNAGQAQAATTLTDDERADWIQFVVNAATYVMGAMAEQTVGARDRGEDWQERAAGEALNLFMPHVRDLLAARHAPAADHTATLDRIRALLADLTNEINENRADLPPAGPPRVAHVYRTAGLSDSRDRLRAALDGDTDQCGDPGRDDEHGGGA